MLLEGEPNKWFEKVYVPMAEDYESNTITPLTLAYLAWLQSKSLLTYFNSNYDDLDADSGTAFCVVVQNCLTSSERNPKIFGFYRSWLISNEVSENNYMLRGLSLNLKEVKSIVNESISSMKKAAKDTLSDEFLLALPWGGVINAYSNATSHLPDSKAAPSKLLACVISPALSALDSRSSTSFLAMLGMIEGKPIINSRVKGTLSQAVDLLINEVIEINPRLAKVDRILLRKKLEIYSRGSKRSMAPLGGGNWDIKISLDRLAIEGMPSGDSVNYGKELKHALIDMKDFDFRGNKNKLLLGLLADRSSQLSVIGVILGGFTIYSAAKEVDSYFKLDEELGRFSAAMIAGVGSLGDLTAAIIQKGTSSGLLTSRLLTKSTLKISELVGRRLGLGAGIIFFICDMNAAFKAAKVNDSTMVGLYITSGIATLGSALAFYYIGYTLVTSAGVAAGSAVAAATTGILSATSLLILGGVLGVAVIAIVFVIASKERSELQKWMRLTYFGIASNGQDADSDNRYNTLEVEQKAFKELAKS